MLLRPTINLFIHDEAGATMVEYAIMIGFIAAVCVGTIALIGPELADLFAPVPPVVGGS